MSNLDVIVLNLIHPNIFPALKKLPFGQILVSLSNSATILHTSLLLVVIIKSPSVILLSLKDNIWEADLNKGLRDSVYFWSNIAKSNKDL